MFSVIIGGILEFEVDWFKDEKVIEDKGRFVIRDDFDKGKFFLIIEEIFVEDVGIYKCVVFNEVGEELYEVRLSIIFFGNKSEFIFEVFFEVFVNVELVIFLSFFNQLKFVVILGELGVIKD